jgi:hypothetical protein
MSVCFAVRDDYRMVRRSLGGRHAREDTALAPIAPVVDKSFANDWNALMYSSYDGPTCSGRPFLEPACLVPFATPPSRLTSARSVGIGWSDAGFADLCS